MVKRRETQLETLGIKGSGVYCIYPFSSFDKHDKGCFKIGVATNSFDQRLENVYHTYFPMGFYYKCLLEFPREEKDSKYMNEIERFLLLKLENDNDAHCITSDARTNKDGATEWVYTSQKTIEKVFKQAKVKFGGELRNYDLTKESMMEENKSKPLFIGKIRFV
jgi:hypothetical protein